MLAEDNPNPQAALQLGVLLGGITGVIVGGDQQKANNAMQGAGNAIANNDINLYPNIPSVALQASGYGATTYPDGTICSFQSSTGAGCVTPGGGTPSEVRVFKSLGFDLPAPTRPCEIDPDQSTLPAP